MTDINVCSFSGRIVKDSTFKIFNTGMGVINFTVAVNRSVKNGDQWVEEASYIDCKYFSKGTEKLSTYLRKGVPVSISGSLEQERWQDQTGSTKSRLVVSVNDVRWYSNPPDNSYQQPTQSYQLPAQNYQQPTQPVAPPQQRGFPEDIPF